MNRRDFVQKSLPVLAIAGVALQAGCSQKEAKISQSKKGPIIISTWDNQRANQAALQKLMEGGSVIDAVVAGIKVPEADAADRSVGYGGRPDRSGQVTLDACIMDELGRAGSVSYVKNFAHPIEIARKVMEETPHVMLVGEGAETYAKSQGMEMKNLLTEESKKEFEEWAKTAEYKPKVNIELHDTIGLLVMDQEGKIAGGCSTSGMAYKMEGRVGDSPIIGAGLYIDHEIGGATCTGHGEYVLRTLSTFLVIELMRQGLDVQSACVKAVERVVSHHKHFKPEEIQVGIIAIDIHGNIGAASLVPGFVYAVTDPENSQVNEAVSVQS